MKEEEVEICCVGLGVVMPRFMIVSTAYGSVERGRNVFLIMRTIVDCVGAGISLRQSGQVWTSLLEMV